MKARIAVALASVGLTAIGMIATAGAANATPVTPSATAFSAAAATGNATLAPQLTVGGALGSLVNSLVSPIVNGALNPLVGALQSTVNSTVVGALGVGSAFTAAGPSQQATTGQPGAFPADTFPTTCSATSPTQPCYRGPGTNLNATPIANVGVSTLSGYTEQVGSDPTLPILGRAQVTSPSISLLSGITSLTNPIVSAGVVDSKSTCPNAGSSSPSASVSATSVSLLGGLITLGVLNGSIANLTVNGTNVGSLTSLAPTNLVGGIVVRSYGTALRVDIPISLSQLLAGLGLGAAAVTELLGDVTSTSLTLSLVVGPHTAVTATTASAWGLGIGADLSGLVKFNLLGLATAQISIPSGISGSNTGNLLDLRLGYTSCQSGSAPTGTSTPAIPPANV